MGKVNVSKIWNSDIFLQCYQACLHVIKDLVEQAKRSPTSPSLPASPGEKPKSSHNSNIVLAEEARHAAEEMLQGILQSEVYQDFPNWICRRVHLSGKQICETYFKENPIAALIYHKHKKSYFLMQSKLKIEENS